MICEEIVSDWEMVRYRVVPPNVGMHEGIVATKIMIFVTGQLFQKVENDENRFFAITSSKLVRN